MAQTKTSRKKPKLSRRGLKDNGVYYECKVLQSDAWLPDQATTARDALLNFEHRVPLVKRRELEEDLRSVEDEGLDLWDGSYSPLPTAEDYYWRLKSMAGRSDLGVQEEMVETVALGRKDADDFRALQNDNEAGWTHALIANIFKRPDRIAWGEQARL